MKPVRRSGIIRQRGQLTIPEVIRKAVSWLRSFSVVSISLEHPRQVVIEPYEEKEVDWEKLRKQMKKIQAFTGKGEQKESLSEFIARDRLQRR